METEDDLRAGAFSSEHVFVSPTREPPMPTAAQRGGGGSAGVSGIGPQGASGVSNYHIEEEDALGPGDSTRNVKFSQLRHGVIASLPMPGWIPSAAVGVNPVPLAPINGFVSPPHGDPGMRLGGDAYLQSHHHPLQSLNGKLLWGPSEFIPGANGLDESYWSHGLMAQPAWNLHEGFDRSSNGVAPAGASPRALAAAAFIRCGAQAQLSITAPCTTPGVSFAKQGLAFDVAFGL
eukprot:CAMPEP_0115736434 /NCGR_PEP_ID=MMETSP0272-20121206/87259_1 /TAXON_ID=71861 /ORGANISM="Scrippsiella trochoidea, Strain CCMP3099" /LENGTH=233 /DNA_ID=CAMNT_0003180623 /DNA_START=73 /DNA_END=773 /DNA_ORIENTATION=-